MSGERQLNQNAINSGVFVQAVDKGHEFSLLGVCRQVIGLRQEANFFAILTLV